MPRMDGTGPDGKGPGTGRRLGRCFGNNQNMCRNFGMGRGLRRKNRRK